MTLPEFLDALPRLVGEVSVGDLPALAGRLREAELLVESRLRSPASSGNPQGGSPETRPLLLTYTEAASALRCSPSYVETLVRQGKLPHVQLPAADRGGRPRGGRLVRLLASDLRAWAEEHKA